MNSSAKKLFFLNFIVAIIVAPVSSSATTHKSPCPELPAKKNTILLDETGKQVDQLEFDTGNFPFSQIKKDFIFSKKKYHLILSPKTRTIENDCSMSICVVAEQTASKCSNTNEYNLSFGVNPTKAGPGVFKNEFELKISTPNGPDFNRQGFSFEEAITGSFAIPWLTTVRSPELAMTTLSLFQPVATVVEVSLKNIGTIDYKFGSWVGESTQNKDYELIPESCNNISLPPNATCSIKIRKLTAKSPNTNTIEWWNTFKGEDINIRLQFEKINTEKAIINIYNLE